ncbi:MAG: glutathione S-transferase family protein [Sphingomonadales bacterium]
MKLYETQGVPNCRRVTIYLDEKGLTVPRVPVDLMSGEQFKPEFKRMNPAGKVPVLELDDGSFLAESLAIVEYLEELNPEPPMIGATPEARARVRALERQIELGIFMMAGITFQNTAPFFAERFHQSRDTVVYAGKIHAASCRQFDRIIGDKPFVAGDAPTIADCTLAAAIEFGFRSDLKPEPELANLARWWAAFQERPSMR